MSKPLTAADLIAILSEYPPETPIFDGKGFDMHAYLVREQTYDVWSDTPNLDAEGNETPGVGVGIAIGHKY